jgi:glucosamine--fructose-6-phosphate aminotransferase (isomerizing)
MGPGPHPSDLYHTIHAQPSVLRDVLDRCAPMAQEAAGILKGRRHVLLAGTGTSHHAALVGQYLLRGSGADAWALTHQDFALYPPPLRPDDALIAISHRGNKRYGMESLQRAKAVGMPVVGLTGRDSPMVGPAVVIPTAPQERSSTHTASYTGNLAALALMAARPLDARGAPGAEALTKALPTLPELMDAILHREEEVLPVAERLARQGRVVFSGAGPNLATAREGALKVKESSYLVSEGFELETLLHGGLQALQPGDLAVLIAPRGPALDRLGDALRALTLLRATPWLVGDREALDTVEDRAGRPEGTFRFELPPVPEALSPLLAVLPLQLLACFTAERRGTNPDSFREDDPVFARISASYHL